MPKTLDPRRRALLASLAAAPAALVGTRPSAAQEAAAGAAGLASSNVCLLAVEVTEGPYYVDRGLTRADIAEGREGVPLDLVLQVVDAACAPLAGSRVDVWHCDAAGNYSGFEGQGSDASLDRAGETFLRGTQGTDAAGLVTFRTIYPGWYRGRTTHVHLKVFLDEASVLTGQMFFPDALSQYLYDHVAAYGRDGARDTVNANDGIAAEAGEGAYAALREAPGRYVATLVVGVAPSATSASGTGGDGRPGNPPPGPPPSEGEDAVAAPPASLVPGQG